MMEIYDGVCVCVWVSLCACNESVSCVSVHALLFELLCMF